MPSCTSLHSLIPLVPPCMLITNSFESRCSTLMIPCTTLGLFLHFSYTPLGPLALPLHSLYPFIPLVPPCIPLYPLHPLVPNCAPLHYLHVPCTILAPLHLVYPWSRYDPLYKHCVPLLPLCLLAPCFFLHPLMPLVPPLCTPYCHLVLHNMPFMSHMKGWDSPSQPNWITRDHKVTTD